MNRTVRTDCQIDKDHVTFASSRAHVDNTEITLAPMAGAGMGKQLADYLLAQPNFIENMGQVIIRAIKAKTRHWDREAKQFEIEEDCKTQLQAFALCVAHMEGEPVKRIIHQHLGGNGTIDPLAALQESPALLEAAKRMIDKAGYRTAGGERSKARAAERRAKQVEQPAIIEEEMG